MGCLPFCIVRGNEKHTPYTLTSLTKRLARCRPWRHSKKQYNENHTNTTVSSSNPNDEYSARRRLSALRKQEIAKQLERERINQELLEREHRRQQDLEQEHIEQEALRRNGLETELAEEHRFEWDRLELAVSDGPATYNPHQSDLNLAKFSTPGKRPLKRKTTSVPLRDFYGVRDEPLPRAPQPLLAGQRPSGQMRPHKANTSQLQDDSLTDDDEIPDCYLDESVQLPRQVEARQPPRRRVESPEVSPRILPVRSSSSNATTIHHSVASRFDINVLATYSNRVCGSDIVSPKFPLPSFERRKSSRRSIASKSEGINPWAMFDACVQTDSRLNPFGIPVREY